MQFLKPYFNTKSLVLFQFSRMEKPKRQYKKRAEWSKAAEAALLDLWAENIEDLRGIRKNSHVFAEIAQALNEAGVMMTGEEVRVKIKNLTSKYR